MELADFNISSLEQWFAPLDVEVGDERLMYSDAESANEDDEEEDEEEGGVCNEAGVKRRQDAGEY